jgi:hypothetical protein
VKGLDLAAQARMILRARDDLLVELRAVTPEGQVRRDWFRLDQVDDLARRAATLSAYYNCWIGAAPRTRRGGSREDVAPALAVWADCDSTEATNALRRFPLRPSLVVRSSTLDGEHLQAWWSIAEPLEPNELEPVLRRLAAALGSDTSVCDAPRVLRAVGTLNHKRAQPEPVEAIYSTGEIHELAVLTVALPAAPVAEEKTQKAGCGVMPDVEQVPPGEMYPHLEDLVIRLACAGILHPDLLERMLVAEFEAVRVPGRGYGDEATGRLDTRRLAEWATESRIAGHERSMVAWDAALKARRKAAKR